MTKEELRKVGKLVLNQLAANPQKKKEKEQVILIDFFSSTMWKQAKTVGIVRSMTFEFDTNPILQKGLSEGKRMAIPKSFENRELSFFQVDERTSYERTSFGVEEPISHIQMAKEAIDLLIVPGIIFSSTGYRIGHGGGFYDQYLSTYSGKSVSLVFSDQLNDQWFPEEFDQPVDHLFQDQLKGEQQ